MAPALFNTEANDPKQSSVGAYLSITLTMIYSVISINAISPA